MMGTYRDPVDAFNEALEDHRADQPELERLVGLAEALTRLHAQAAAPKRLRDKIRNLARATR
jgi:hypothetical protein